MSIFPLEASALRAATQPLLDESSIAKETRLPGTNGQMTLEQMTIVFPSFAILQAAVVTPTPIDVEVANQVVEKLEPFIGKHLYPSTIAHLIYELAFVDQAITPKLRTDNIGYVLSNLGSNSDYLIKELFAFYYAYSFEHFAPKK